MVNHLGGYDALTSHALLCIIVGMTSLHVTNVSNCTAEDAKAMQIHTLCLLDILVIPVHDRKVLTA
jgi:hypothetical protein